MELNSLSKYNPESLLQHLINVIHRDGGKTLKEHGIQQAYMSARDKVLYYNQIVSKLISDSQCPLNK